MPWVRLDPKAGLSAKSMGRTGGPAARLGRGKPFEYPESQPILALCAGRPQSPAGSETGAVLRVWQEPLRFRRATARYLSSLTVDARLDRLRQIAGDNARTLGLAIDYCVANRFAAFRVNSEILPLSTHPRLAYRLADIDRDGEIHAAFADAARRAKRGGLRLSLHPDQFIVPGSVRAEVVRSSLAELEHQAAVAELIGAEQITLHGGGKQGGKVSALARLRNSLGDLSPRARKRIVLENDDRIYSVEDLLPICDEAASPWSTMCTTTAAIRIA